MSKIGVCCLLMLALATSTGCGGEEPRNWDELYREARTAEQGGELTTAGDLYRAALARAESGDDEW